MLYEEGFNSGNLEILDRLLASNFVDHNPVPGQASSREGFKALIASMRASPEGWVFSVERMTRTHDLVVATVTAHASRERRGAGPGAPRDVRGVVLYRVVNGKITDRWGATSPTHQLGSTLAPEAEEDKHSLVL
jgi:predicted SnoaL-like aldol condensation-catalyzing enzyme